MSTDQTTQNDDDDWDMEKARAKLRPDLVEIETQIAEAARKSRLARKIAAWAPVVGKAVVALWMLAVLYELHEIRRQNG
jgi:hypothetical protein